MTMVTIEAYINLYGGHLMTDNYQYQVRDLPHANIILQSSLPKFLKKLAFAAILAYSTNYFYKANYDLLIFYLLLFLFFAYILSIILLYVNYYRGIIISSESGYMTYPAPNVNKSSTFHRRGSLKIDHIMDIRNETDGKNDALRFRLNITHRFGVLSVYFSNKKYRDQFRAYLNSMKTSGQNRFTKDGNHHS